jgi:hypothetical protein
MYTLVVARIILSPLSPLTHAYRNACGRVAGIGGRLIFQEQRSLHCYAIAQTVTRCLPTAVALVRVQARSCVICDEWNGTRGFSKYVVPPSNSHSTNCSTSINHHVTDVVFIPAAALSNKRKGRLRYSLTRYVIARPPSVSEASFQGPPLGGSWGVLAPMHVTYMTD